MWQGKGWSPKEVMDHAFESAMAVWNIFKDHDPIIGFWDMMNLNLSDVHAKHYFYVEYSFAAALAKLINKGCWPGL
jgi:hypothetical protein